NFYCAADGSCVDRKSNGEKCNLSAGKDCMQSDCRACESTFCIDDHCCNAQCDDTCDVCDQSLGATADGVCSPASAGYAGRPTCGAYVWNGIGTQCITNCSSDANCATDYYCSAAGFCVARKPQAAACNDAAGQNCLQAGCRVCAGGAGKCKDGYCCE